MEYSLTVLVTETSGAPVIDDALAHAGALQWQTQFPGGVYGPGSFFVPYDPRRKGLGLRAGQTVKFVDGGRVVFEGEIAELTTTYQGDELGQAVTVAPPFGKLERAGIDRRWVDDRIDEAAWSVDTTVSGAELATIDREARLRWTPKGVAWANGDYARLEYTMPTGETVGRVTYSYAMAEGVQAWELQFAELPATVFHSVTASGIGTKAANTTTAPQSLSFDLVSKAAQTPVENGLYYAQITDLLVYATRSHGSATLGNVNVYEIALDIITLMGGAISANVDGLDSGLTFAIKPFITQGRETFGAILARAAAYGDTAFQPVGFRLLRSDLASDGLPKLAVDTYPALTDYDYEIALEEAEFSLSLNIDAVYNYIVVEYTDAAGETATIGPADNAALTNAASVTAYGTRYAPGGKITIDNATAATALQYGQRFLARNALPTWRVTSPIVVTALADKSGGRIPARWIEAGSRLRVVDMIDAVTGGLGVNFLITATDYSHEERTVSLALGGAPDDISIWLAQRGGPQIGYVAAK